MSKLNIGTSLHLLLLPAITLPCMAQHGAPMVQVDPHKTVVLVGEPLIISTTVFNAGREDIELHHQNAPTLINGKPCAVSLLLRHNDGEFETWSDKLRVLRKTRPISLAPGETMTVDLVMLFSRKDGFFAPQPGKYWISGRIITTAEAEFEATPVEIEVKDPTSADRAVWQWLDAQKEQYGRLVQTPGEAELSDEFLRECARLCDTSHSAYVEYLTLFLSRSYREGPNKDAQQSARFAEIARAKASSDKTRSEAERLVPKGEPKAPR